MQLKIIPLRQLDNNRSWKKMCMTKMNVKQQQKLNTTLQYTHTLSNLLHSSNFSVYSVFTEI